MLRSRRTIFAVIVTYYPDLALLEHLLVQLLPQVEKVLVIDNGSRIDVASLISDQYLSTESLEVVALGENLGIAVAQNRGIEMARECGADYVILFDQDSAPATDMIERLRFVAETKAKAGYQVASVGPRYTDNRQDNPPPFIKVKGLRVERQACCCADSVVEVDYLIASGCLIPMSALDVVGEMLETLFIDYVDIEWGLRAKNKGLQSYGACAAYMHHSLGDEPIGFLGQRFPARSPLRHYYMFRNAFWMYRQSWLPLHWKLADGWRLLLKYGFYTLFAKPRHQHWWMMSKGVWHGLTGRMGKLN